MFVSNGAGENPGAVSCTTGAVPAHYRVTRNDPANLRREITHKGETGYG